MRNKPLFRRSKSSTSKLCPARRSHRRLHLESLETRRLLAGDPVLDWNAVALDAVKNDSFFSTPDQGGPTRAANALAVVHLAMYDAVNATEPKHYRPYLLDRRFSARASQDAAVAAAAYGVLRHLVATVPNILDANRTTLLATLATQYEAALQPIADGPSKTKGVDAGEAAAAVMIAARADEIKAFIRSAKQN